MLTELFNGLPDGVVERLDDFHVEVSSKMAAGPIHELLAASVLRGGKRLRPLLTYLYADFFGARLDDCDVLARSIEQVHAASLAHDDVIDNATKRRGIDSINIQATNKKAVLAGDYLLADVIITLSQQTNLVVVQEMAKVIQELAKGEWVQWEAAHNRSYSPKVLEEIASKKTASVMSWCCLAPALLVGVKAQAQEQAKLFGQHLGLAFQQMDDTLDFSHDSQKDFGLDLDNEQVNFVMYEWLLESPQRMQAYQKGRALSQLSENANFTLACDKVQKMAHAHLDKAAELLDQLRPYCQSEKAYESLKLIVRFVGEREF